VVPETVDCIRALTGIETDAARSIAKTDQAFGITKTFLPATTQPVPHVTDADLTHPGVDAVPAGHARFADVGFKGSEEPTDMAGR
jgi:glyceraldehyde-3-phosphate dehydrogenase (NAD(P))